MNSALNPIEKKVCTACVASMHYPNAVWTVVAKGYTAKVTSAEFMVASYIENGYKVVARFKNGEEV